jgi:aryl-alcohol dehydrogenase-like predicted oxidoreductase
MKTRKLGKTNLQVPPIMLGGNVYGWTISEAESLRQLDRALDAGLNFIDTADVYSRWVPGHTGGESETIVGKWFAASGKRAKVVLATKVGMDMGEGRVGLGAAYIEKAVEDSLRRLQTEYIDLYQSHNDDENAPLEETLGAYQKLIDQGKVRYIGASNYSGARLREAMETSAHAGLAAYATLQPLYNLMERAAYESDLDPVVAEYGLAVVPYFSLAGGFLTGKYRTPQDAEGKARGGIVGKYINERGFRVVRALEDVAARLSATPASVALAWLIAKPAVTPIASATSDAHLNQLIAAADLKLDAAAMKQLDAASAPAAATAS